ncbi:MAG: DUF4157 domain-containing protein [Spirirestis rafaelensis WJT71-NPBG6]|jgi:hypothetical protein|nr:DUF4157 domain-containing protein [Spirirestis rafaelensis WJT71-NPBG6]
MQVGEQMSDRIRIQRRKQIPDSYSYPQLATDTSGLRIGTAQTSVIHEISRISLHPQAQLTVSQPGDVYEQEADRVAQQVMGMGDRTNNNAVQREVSPQEEEENLQLKSLGNTITPLVQREEIPEEEDEEENLQMKSLDNLAIQREEILEEEEEEEENLQMKSLDNLAIQREEIPEEDEEEEELIQAKSSLQRFNDGGLAASSDISSKLHSRKGQGNPLAGDVRNFMEPRFGVDFSNVKVHTDGEAVQMSRELGAQAFTYGSDVYFGVGKSPGNNELMAHELTHVVQQVGGVQRKCAACEEEEELMRKEDSATHYSPSKSATIQRHLGPTRLQNNLQASQHLFPLHDLSRTSISLQRYALPASLECNDVVSWLDSNSPYTPEWAETRCTYTFNGQLRVTFTTLSDGSVEARVTGHPKLSVSKSCPIDSPRWSPSQRPNRAAEVTAWNRMKATLDAHEQQHRRIGEKQRVIMENNFRVIDITGNGSDREQARSSAISQVVAEQGQWQQDAQNAQDAIDPFRGAVLSCP